MEEFGILGEDADFLAVNKPAGLLVHPSKPGGPRTLWDGLCEMLGYELATGGQISIINRLDRETSGVVLVAKTAAAARSAGLAMQNGEFSKEYEALVFGWPEWEERTIDEPILRLGEVEEAPVWLERAVHPLGSPALTRLETTFRGRRADGGQFARVRAFPRTGRTHQIRVHLGHAGHPVIGDKIYARGRECYLEFIAGGWSAELERRLWLPRHALHCARMAWGAREWAAPPALDLAAFVAAAQCHFEQPV